VVVGTEAVFTRVRRCAAVIVADADQYLLAPRERARRDLVTVVAKAGRLVGDRRQGRGPVVLQTRRADDDVLDAMVRGDLGVTQQQEIDTARDLLLPPFGARAVVTGVVAGSFIEGLDLTRVRVATRDDGFVVVAGNTQDLCAALAQAPRPEGRFRVAVD
jgi:hypothetical protein